MIICNTTTELPKKINKSIFLAGPTHRGNVIDEKGIVITKWRQEVLDILKKKEYDGVVFVPEPFSIDYSTQVEWENKCLNIADCILFWVPRDKDLPGFTTNIEFGEWMKSGKIVLGFPEDAERMDYLKYKANTFHVKVSNDMDETITNALEYLGDGADREGGEINIPLHIWNMHAFQQWYGAQRKVGNTINNARVEYALRPRGKVFLCVLYADIHIAAEARNKTNEVVILRPDISAILAYKREPDIMKTKILLVKEFRTPASNEDCFIHELPGGSSFHPTKSAVELAQDELHEETGLHIDTKNFRYYKSRQLNSTLCAHKAHLFAVALTDHDLDKCYSLQHETHGVTEDSEKTYIEIKTLEEIMEESLLDWSMIGMIAQVIVGKA